MTNDEQEEEAGAEQLCQVTSPALSVSVRCWQDSKHVSRGRMETRDQGSHDDGVTGPKEAVTSHLCSNNRGRS